MSAKTKVLCIAAALSIFVLVLQFSSAPSTVVVPSSFDDSKSTRTPQQQHNFISTNKLNENKKSVTIPSPVSSSSSKITDSDYYPNGRPDRTISLVSVEERKRMKLCASVSSSSSDLIAPQINLPWIAEDIILGGFESLAEIISKENLEKFWGYSPSSTPSEKTECFLPFGHIRRILSRARLTAQIKFNSDNNFHKNAAELKQLSKLLSIYAPAWRITSSSSSSTTVITLERRAKVFIFGITGGNLASSRRARYAEWTWGARSPIQWFADNWDENFRPIYKDQHPLYVKDKFNHLTFKISRVWQIVHKYYWSLSHDRIDWFIRLWDDNYFYEENLYPILYRLPFNPQKDEVLAGKLGWRHLGPPDAIFPFAGGGAGWYLTSAGMKKFGDSIDDMEQWIPKLRAKKDIFLPHGMHDEDVFLTAWIGTFMKINCTNIPGVEHVSPGMAAKQRCLTDETLFDLRWKEDKTIFFDYTGAKSRELRVEDSWYSYTKPIIWHYMSPKRLLKLEGLLYHERRKDKGGDLPQMPEDAPGTSVDLPPRKKGKTCYPGVPTGGAPKRGVSLFEEPLPKERRDVY